MGEVVCPHTRQHAPWMHTKAFVCNAMEEMASAHCMRMYAWLSRCTTAFPPEAKAAPDCEGVPPCVAALGVLREFSDPNAEPENNDAPDPSIPEELFELDAVELEPPAFATPP